MEIKEFVQNTLTQIVEGAKIASNEEYKFDLDSITSKGVHFNLAVINSEKNEQVSKGGGGIGIKVVSAEYAKQNNNISGSEVISRIEFNIKHRDLKHEREVKNNKVSYRSFRKNI